MTATATNEAAKLDIDVDETLSELFTQDKYRLRLGQMQAFGTKSVTIAFMDLYAVNNALAEKILDDPDVGLEWLSNAALQQLKFEDPAYFEAFKREERVTVRLTELPAATSLRTLGSEHLGKLVAVEAIVTRVTPVRPLVVKAAYTCKICGSTTYATQKTGPFLTAPFKCSDPTCEKKCLEFNQERSTFIDSQDLRLQERPEDLPPGHLPRTLHVKLVGKELVNVARPGDHISAVGILRAFAPSQANGGKLRAFLLQMDANSLDILGKEPETAIPSAEEEQQILTLSHDPWIHRKIIQSIAPSIFGYEHVKEAIMYLLFSGVSKQLPDISIRGEINVLLLGDPGTAKSQLLQYVARIAPRGLYTSGRGTTAAGLTAAVVREKGGSFSLEAGVLVLADKGIACIDEIEKMRPEDRVAIHEAMEQHTVSVAKGGIIATLNARTSVFAAANPSLGRYEPHRTVAENLSLPVTILSRFDLIFVMRDIPEPAADRKLSTHILSTHMNERPPLEPPIKAELLRKYVSYSKTIRPKLTQEAQDHLGSFYLAMRKASESEGSPIAITARQLESLIRLAEARARVTLRQTVTAEDAEAAVAIMRRSLEEVGIDMSLDSPRVDIDLIMTGKPKSLRDKMQLVFQVLSDGRGPVNREDLLAILEETHKVPRAEGERMIQQLLRQGSLFEPSLGMIMLVR